MRLLRKPTLAPAISVQLYGFSTPNLLSNFSFRNGLRPSRFYVLKNNIMVMASEVGVYDTDPSNVSLKVGFLGSY